MTENLVTLIDKILVSQLSESLTASVSRLILLGQSRKRILATVKAKAPVNSMLPLQVEAYLDEFEKTLLEILSNLRGKPEKNAS